MLARTCSRSPPSPVRSGARSGPTTPTRDSTARSDAAPTWSASSPTATPWSVWSAPSWPSSTTNGPKAAATSDSTCSPEPAPPHEPNRPPQSTPNFPNWSPQHEHLHPTRARPRGPPRPRIHRLVGRPRPTRTLARRLLRPRPRMEARHQQHTPRPRRTALLDPTSKDQPIHHPRGLDRTLPTSPEPVANRVAAEPCQIAARGRSHALGRIIKPYLGDWHLLSAFDASFEDAVPVRSDHESDRSGPLRIPR